MWQSVNIAFLFVPDTESGLGTDQKKKLFSGTDALSEKTLSYERSFRFCYLHSFITETGS